MEAILRVYLLRGKVHIPIYYDLPHFTPIYRYLVKRLLKFCSVPQANNIAHYQQTMTNEPLTMLDVDKLLDNKSLVVFGE